MTPDTTASLQRGQLLLRTGRPAEAEAELCNALAHDPDDADVMALLAMAIGAQEDRRRYPEATAIAEAAIAREPDNAFTHRVLANILLRRKQTVKAERAARRAVELDPEYPDSYGLLAAILADTFRAPEALRMARAGLALDPDHAQCRYVALALMQGLGQHRQAAEQALLALRTDPEDAASHLVRGWALLADGRAAEALPHLQEAVRQDPGDEQARRGLLLAKQARSPVMRLVIPLLARRDTQTPGNPLPGLILVLPLVVVLLSCTGGGIFLHKVLGAPSWTIGLGLVVSFLAMIVAFLGSNLLNMEMGLDFHGERPARGLAAAAQWTGVVLSLLGLLCAGFLVLWEDTAWEEPYLGRLFLLGQLLGWPARLAPLFHGSRVGWLYWSWYALVAVMAFGLCLGARSLEQDAWASVLIVLWLPTVLAPRSFQTLFPSLRGR